MGLCEQQGFPLPSAHIHTHTQIQCKGKTLFFPASCSHCVRAVWHVPWCFLEGSFHLSVRWKMNWQSHLKNAPKWRNMSSSYLLWKKRRREQAPTVSYRCGASGYSFTSSPCGEICKMIFTADLYEFHTLWMTSCKDSSTSHIQWEQMIRPSMCQFVSQHEAKGCDWLF